MAAVDDIRSSLDLSQIAEYLGTDEQTAGEAVDQALAQLVGAMDDNAARPDGAVGLSRAALGDHLAGPYGDQVDINNVDTADGEKIVHHVFSPTQVQTLGSGMGGQLLRKLLPMLAPIVMGYLAKKLQEQMGGRSTGQAPQQGGGGGLGDILGDLLGGGSASRQPDPAPQSRPSTGGTGGFQVPPSPDSGLRMDDSGAPPASGQQAPAQAPAGGGAGDLLGGILSEILLGRRR